MLQYFSTVHQTASQIIIDNEYWLNWRQHQMIDNILPDNEFVWK